MRAAQCPGGAKSGARKSRGWIFLGEFDLDDRSKYTRYIYINDPLTATKAITHTRIQTGLSK